MKYICLIMLCCFGSTILYAQDSLLPHIDLPQHLLDKVEQQQSMLTAEITNRTAKALAKMKKLEEKLSKKLAQFDSSKANEFATDMYAKYASLESKLADPKQLAASSLHEYVPRLDSLSTMLQFLQPMAEDKLKLDRANEQIAKLKGTLGQTENVTAFMQERKSYLNNLLSSYKQLPQKYIDKYLGKYSKQAAYYKAQVVEWKETIKNPQKMEALALKLLNKLPAFQEFMQQNGELAGLFGQGNAGNNSAVNLAGLQTRQQVMQGIQQQFGSQLSNPQQYVQQQVQSAQAQLSDITAKLNDLNSGSYGNGDAGMPDNQPLNSQKSKSFLKRLEYGINLQSPIKQYRFPASNDLAIMLGYKVNDRFTTGIGLAYKFSLGTGLKDMHLTHEGIGLRSYVDWKINGAFGNQKKLLGNIWMSGGYEMNYWQRFQNIPGWHSLLWTRSGLIGITKKIEYGKRNIKTQVLWDFLSYETNSTPVVFRVGVTF